MEEKWVKGSVAPEHICNDEGSGTKDASYNVDRTRDSGAFLYHAGPRTLRPHYPPTEPHTPRTQQATAEDMFTRMNIG